MNQDTDPTQPEAQAITAKRNFLAGAGWNALGRGLPLLLALVLTPILLSQMGVERWGIFTLALSLVGVVSILDLGIGASLTRVVAAELAVGREDRAAAMITTALAILAVVLIPFTLVAVTFMPAVVDHALNVPPALRDQSIAALRIMVLTLPLVVLSAALWGTLTACQLFRAANLVNIPVGIFYYLGPAIALALWDNMVGVMLSLALLRLVTCIAYFVLVWRRLPALHHWPRPEWRNARSLMKTGVWMMLSNILSPLSLYGDRFLIGALFPLAVVSYYTTSFDLLTRFWIVSVSVTGALFPAMASTFSSDPARTGTLMRHGAALVIGLLFPACLITVLFAKPLLSLWLHADFAEHSYGVLRILAIGIFFSCSGSTAGSFLDAIGRPDAGAKFMALLAVLFIPLAMLLTWRFGITGAAVAFALRSATECLGRLALCRNLQPQADRDSRIIGSVSAMGGLILAISIFVPAGIMSFLTVLTVLPAYLLFGAYCMFERHERLVALAGMLRLMPRRIGASVS